MQARQEKKARGPNDREKLGLALSGGGFRASLFHIGVLAQMAKLGLSRHVEVISTVSGGSIIGALYYLHVKKLLEAKEDALITDDDYVAIVERIEVDFLKGVQANIRMRTFLNPMKALRMTFADYSRSDHIGELYDRYFYRPVVDPSHPKPIEMRELKIQPKGAELNFSPLAFNAPRRAKTPILLLNATSLNTGHNWRFEAVRMGEPERNGVIAQEIDKNLRLRLPPSYEAIIPKQQSIEVGLAVAASACVPGLFPPLSISDLYPGDIRVQLVDGGVHDNLGIGGLQDMGCRRFIISDASGQMRDEEQPATIPPSVLGRSNSILMDRVREEELFRLIQHENSPVAFMHLLKGLTGRALSWIGPDGKPAEPPKREREAPLSSESFGVDCEVQDLLSQMRTDLDSFTDVEAYALMYDGYRMSGQELRNTHGIKELISESGSPGRWRFLAIEPWMAAPTPRFLKELRAARQTVLKVFRLSRSVAIVTAILIAVLLGLLALALGPWIQRQLARSFTLGGVLLALVMLAVGFVPVLGDVFKFLRVLQAPTSFIVRLVGRAILPALASAFIAIHIFVFDPIFLRLGRMEGLGTHPKDQGGKKP